jgi:hypothetical protein
MGYDLCGRGGYCFVNIDDWGPLLGIAQAWGWKPAGTLLPYGPPEAQGDPGPDWEWNGGYLCNEHQEVTDEDALALAAALDRALAAREKAARARMVKGNVVTLQVNVVTLSPDARDTGAECWRDASGDVLQPRVLKAVADFARQGSFLIK